MRKPLSIIILSLLFIISPAAILFFNAALNMVPLIGYGSIIYRLPVQDILVLALYPIAGISIWMVKKWGWWVLIISASLMIIYNIITLYFNPFSSGLIVLLMNAALFAVALLFFRKHLIAPYFHPRLRWWEQDQRYEIDIYLKFVGMDRNVIISDISQGGCYIYVDFLIESGSELPVMIVCGAFHISLKAKVMRISRESDRYNGYGLMFVKIDEVQRTGLDHLMEKLKSISNIEGDPSASQEKRASTRFYISYDLSLKQGSQSQPVNLSDISMSGCAISTALEVNSGSRGTLHFLMEQISHSIDVEIVWKRSSGENRFYGLKFVSLGKDDKKALKKMIGSAKELGARRRETDLEDYYRRCDEDAEQTPYKIIGNIKRLFGR